MHTFFLFLISLLSILSYGQSMTLDETIYIKKQHNIDIDFEYGKVDIVAWNNPYIKIEGTVLINLGKSNEAFELDIEKSNNKIVIKSSVDDKKAKRHRVITSKNGEKKVKPTQLVSSCNSYSNEYEIELKILIPKQLKIDVKSVYADIELNNIQSNICAHSTYGDLTAKVTKIENISDLKIESTYADVDISIPSDAKLDLNAKTQFGSIYTNMDLEFQNSSQNQYSFGEKIKATLNGGTSINLIAKSDYSNIYLRKL